MIENVEVNNSANIYGNTPLYFAAWNGHFEICDINIQNVEDKNSENNDRVTILNFGAEMGHFET